ncbi:hypothetical protein [Mesorhizobium sp. RMAD-H1]|uniref:hypothetical protein n=1 Tax=Mesorhizobium sp. RMAD-H1 TaxID=2587065 RepID=UPI0016139F02|nr:hypothetical protein [Mesorhizobium sp. RMAD-H1]MBB2971036.1 hypothetical protein [Mesorhizobium sp. RMAD-H1]
MHSTSDANQEKRGITQLFACVLWIAAFLLAFHWTFLDEREAEEPLSVTAANPGDLRSPAPAKEQSAPARNPMRAAALEALHLKATPLRLDGGPDPALLPALFEAGVGSAGGPLLNAGTARFAGMTGHAFAARAPPAAA